MRSSSVPNVSRMSAEDQPFQILGNDKTQLSVIDFGGEGFQGFASFQELNPFSSEHLEVKYPLLFLNDDSKRIFAINALTTGVKTLNHLPAEATPRGGLGRTCPPQSFSGPIFQFVEIRGEIFRGEGGVRCWHMRKMRKKSLCQ